MLPRHTSATLSLQSLLTKASLTCFSPAMNGVRRCQLDGVCIRFQKQPRELYVKKSDFAGLLPSKSFPLSQVRTLVDESDIMC